MAQIEFGSGLPSSCAIIRLIGLPGEHQWCAHFARGLVQVGMCERISTTLCRDTEVPVKVGGHLEVETLIFSVPLT